MSRWWLVAALASQLLLAACKEREVAPAEPRANQGRMDAAPEITAEQQLVADIERIEGAIDELLKMGDEVLFKTVRDLEEQLAEKKRQLAELRGKAPPAAEPEPQPKP